jgi:hypothetical protein
MTDLWYWEQRCGNWGAQAFTQGDTYRETLSLFNCRDLLVSMLALPARYRQAENQLYRGIIAATWPALLQAPINPPVTVKDYVKRLGRRTGLWQVLQRVRYA